MATITDAMDERCKLRKIEQIFDHVNRVHFDREIRKPTFRLNRRMRKAARADLIRWQMDISTSYHDRYGWDGELRKTIKHEMIHFYLKTAHKPFGHTKYFKEIMEQIGCDLYCKSNKRPYRYIFECPSCRKEYRARKWMAGRYSCGECSNGRFNKKHVLELKRRLH